LKPALRASATDSGFRIFGVEKELMSLRTGLRHSGQFSKGGALTGRVSEKPPLQIRQSPEHGSYS
jgi:hypothetical protein